MICFRCGTPIPDGAPRCQTCAVDTGATQKTATPAPPPAREATPRPKLAGLLEPGELVADRYEVRYLLGEGPTGVTYRALDQEVEIEIALKVIGAALLPQADERDRFVKGLSRLVQVSHSNVVRCFQAGVHGGRAFLALQLCEGLSLRKLAGLRREKGQAFTLADLEPIVSQVVRGLSAIHKRGLVAGALRPENVIVLPDAVKVADVSVWRHLPHAQLEVLIATTDSARYLAPEVKKGQVADPRADSYSLAAILQEMLGAAESVPAPLAEVLFEAMKDTAALRPSIEQLADEVQSIVRTGKRAVVKSSPARGVPAVAQAPKTEKIEAPTSDAATERTSRISEEELAVALEPDRQETRQVHKDELLALRAQSTGDTQQIAADELIPADDDDPPQEEFLLPPTGRLETAFTGAPPPKPAGADKGAAFDDMKTIPVEKIGPPEVATEPSPVVVTAVDQTGGGSPPPRRAEPTGAPPLTGPPPPVAMARPHAHEGDDMTPLPPPAVLVTPPRGTPVMSLAPAPLPLPPPPPPRGNGAIPVAVPTQLTMRVAAMPPPVLATFGSSVAPTRSGISPSGVVKLVVFFIAATGAALVMLWMLQNQRADQERQAKEKQMELLRLREGLNAAKTPAVASPSLVPDAAPPQSAAATAYPDEGTSAGCPLGAKRNRADGHDFCIDAYEYPGGHIVPRTGISWADAVKLCESRGERLCTRREWLASCRGPSGASYPYGNMHDVGRCNVDGEPQAAGSFPRCRSPVGTFDMLGNVSEWVGDKQIVGGSALRHDVRTRCDFSQKIDPNIGYSDVGFRCCVDVK